MKNTIFAVLIMGFYLILSQNNAYAEATCTEKVLNVTIHNNGSIYFMTDKTCSQAWCQLNWVWDAKLMDRGYAALLTAKSTGSDVVINWTSINNCTTQNPGNASPTYFQIE